MIWKLASFGLAAWSSSAFLNRRIALNNWINRNWPENNEFESPQLWVVDKNIWKNTVWVEKHRSSLTKLNKVFFYSKVLILVQNLLSWPKSWSNIKNEKLFDPLKVILPNGGTFHLLTTETGQLKSIMTPEGHIHNWSITNGINSINQNFNLYFV